MGMGRVKLGNRQPFFGRGYLLEQLAVVFPRQRLEEGYDLVQVRVGIRCRELVVRHDPNRFPQVGGRAIVQIGMRHDLEVRRVGTLNLDMSRSSLVAVVGHGQAWQNRRRDLRNNRACALETPLIGCSTRMTPRWRPP